MIVISGEAKLKVPYKVQLNMTVEEFDALPERKQNELIEEAIDWRDATRSAETDEIDVWDINEA